MIPLVPTKRRLDPKIPKYAVCDIESLRWIEMLMIGYYGRLETEEGKVVFEDEQYFENMFEFCDYCFESRQPFDQIFAHFGGKFDFQFIMKDFYMMRDKYHIDGMIPRGSGLLCFSVSTFTVHDEYPEGIKSKDFLGKTTDGKFKVRARTIKFKDSSALLPFGLATLTKSFGVEHVKGSYDFDNMNQKYAANTVDEARVMMKNNGEWEEMRKYLSHDLKGLSEVLRLYFNQPMIAQAGPAYTMASQALKVFQNYLPGKIPSLRSEDDVFIRRGYFGGRTEIFKPFFEASEKHESLDTYDVNSLYPYVMRTITFPYRVDERDMTTIDDYKKGIYDVTVYVPEELYIPPLGVVHDPRGWAKYIFPVGEFRGRFTSIELEYAMKLGCKVMKVHDGMSFMSCGFLFRDYIDTLYDLRKKSKKGSVDDITYKLLMNSLYGRFGLNIHREELIFDEGQVGVTKHMEIEIDHETTICLSRRPKTLENAFVNVSIAAWVTSAARVHMHNQYMKAPREMYYTDTDSLMTTHKFSSDDKELGALKHEMSSKRACFILPKTYIMEAFEGMFDSFDDSGKKKEEKSPFKIVMKGFDKKKISHFTIEDFYASLEGDLRRLKTTNPEKFATFKTALSKGKFLHLLAQSPRKIQSRYDKRRFTRNYGKWDSEPLRISNGIIMNKPDTESMRLLKMRELEFMHDQGIIKDVASLL